MCFLVRLTSQLAELERTVLCEAVLPLRIQKGKWHHLTFTFEQVSSDNDRASAMVTARISKSLLPSILCEKVAECLVTLCDLAVCLVPNLNNRDQTVCFLEL